jgi:hypothetical protein
MGTDKKQPERCFAKPICAAFSNPFSSELARDCEIISLSRFARFLLYLLPANRYTPLRSEALDLDDRPSTLLIPDYASRIAI